MAGEPVPLDEFLSHLMKTPEGQAWGVQMYIKHPIGITGHAEFDALIRKTKMNTEKPNKYIEVELREILRGDVIQWRGTVFSVLSVDDAEVESEHKGGQIYLWVCQGDSMKTRGRRKSIQGLPDLAIVRRVVPFPGPQNYPQHGPGTISDGEPLPAAQQNDATDWPVRKDSDPPESDSDDGPDDFDDASE